MKIALYFVAAALAACGTNSTKPTAEITKDSAAQAIKAFEDVCLKTAPSFAGAAQAASTFGIAVTTYPGLSDSGFSKDESLGVQISSGKECVVTTTSQRDNTLTKQFLQAVGRYSSTPPSNKVPTKVEVKGVPFIFQHDRNGGEAYVMLKANS